MSECDCFDVNIPRGNISTERYESAKPCSLYSTPTEGVEHDPVTDFHSIKLVNYKLSKPLISERCMRNVSHRFYNNELECDQCHNICQWVLYFHFWCLSFSCQFFTHSRAHPHSLLLTPTHADARISTWERQKSHFFLWAGTFSPVYNCITQGSDLSIWSELGQLARRTISGTSLPLLA